MPVSKHVLTDCTLLSTDHKCIHAKQMVNHRVDGPQYQYLVEWEDTYVPQRAVCFHNRTSSQPLLTCDTCGMTYHATCLGAEPVENRTWACLYCTRDNGPFPEQVRMCKVAWARSWEPELTLRSKPAWDTLLDAWEGSQHHDAPRLPHEPAAPSDVGLTNLQRQQGEPANWDSTLGRDPRKKIHIQCHAVNPDLDVSPPPTYCIQVRTTRHIYKSRVMSIVRACVYCPAGECVGTSSCPYRY